MMNYKSLIAYIALLTLQVPFIILFFMNFISNGEPAASNVATLLFLLIAVVYLILVVVLGIRNIRLSFRGYQNEDLEFCLKGLMMLKYGLIPFFLLNFFFLCAFAIVAFVASRGFMLLAAPLFLVIAIGGTWLAMLPGAFFGVQVIRLGASKGIIASKKELHMILQFFFLADVLDTIYVTAVKFHRGRIAGAIVLGGYLILILACAYVLFCVGTQVPLPIQ